VPATRGQVEKASRLFADVRGEQPGSIIRAPLRNPKTALVVGELDGVLYTTIRDGKEERYIHEFKANSRPLLAASYDGKTIHIVGGRYEFTERGIVDR
jgi:hypothetical protein